MHKLLSIRISHYNEKARWAMDRFAVSYQEEGYMPMFHMLPVWRKVRGSGQNHSDRLSTPYSTPVLVTDDGQLYCDSSAIVRYISERYSTPGTSLYPTPEAAELEAYYDNKLGPHTRRMAYFHALPNVALMRAIAQSNVGEKQSKWFSRMYPLIRSFIQKALKITEKESKRSLERVHQVFGEVAEQISDGRPYLLGEQFTAADLAFACMGSLAVMPSEEEGYGAILPPFEEYPNASAEMFREFRAHPAGQFLLRLFREERGHRQIPYGERK